MIRGRGLRFRLLATAVSLAFAAMVVVDVVAVLTVRGVLASKVDEQLLAVPDAPLSAGDAPVRPPAEAREQFLGDSVLTTLDRRTGEVTSQVVGPALASAPLPDLSEISRDLADGTAPGPSLRTVSAIGPRGGRYRVRVLQGARDGDVLVLAQSLEPVSATGHRVTVVLAGVSLVSLVLVVGLGAMVVRLGLRPLDDLEGAARRIAAGDFTARARQESLGGEVGSLARTFNGMAEQVDDAFAAKTRSEDQLRTFLADASHELRTPLTTIRAYSELIRTGAVPAEPSTRESAARIESEAMRMSALVEDLLLLARLDQRPELQIEGVDLDRLVDETVRTLRATAPDHELSTVRSARSLHVQGDREALRRAISNLVRNATVHTPAGTRIRVSAEAQEGGVAVVVNDDGPGMPAEVAAQVFERFYTPAPGRARAAGGSGLGLAIVQSIARAHGGHCEVETSPGRGARFTLLLPPAGESSARGPAGGEPIDPVAARPEGG